MHSMSVHEPLSTVPEVVQRLSGVDGRTTSDTVAMSALNGHDSEDDCDEQQPKPIANPRASNDYERDHSTSARF